MGGYRETRERLLEMGGHHVRAWRRSSRRRTVEDARLQEDCEGRERLRVRESAPRKSQPTSLSRGTLVLQAALRLVAKREIRHLAQVLSRPSGHSLSFGPPNAPNNLQVLLNVLVFSPLLASSPLSYPRGSQGEALSPGRLTQLAS